MAIKRAPDRDRFGWQDPVADKDLTSPPGSPAEGDRYIVASPASGAWSGEEHSIAEYVGSAWEFYTPAAGWRVDVLDESAQYRFNGSTWVEEQGGTGAQKTQDFVFSEKDGTPFIKVKTADYVIVGTIPWRGTSVMGTPDNIKVVAYQNGSTGTVTIRVYDRTNGNMICTGTTTSDNVPVIVDLGTLSNVPAAESVLELQAKRSSSEGRICSLAFYY